MIRNWQNIDKVVDLLKKEQTEKLTDGEMDQLKEYLSRENISNIHSQINDNEYLAKRFKEYSSFSHKSAFNDFANKVRKEKRKSLFIRITQVAAVIAILFTATTVIVNNKKKDNLAVVKKEIIAPGKNIARLTLADGKKIELNNTTFNIQEQGGAIIKSDSGKISYSHTPKTKDIVYNELYIPRGGEYFLILSDGTKVWLNSDTRIKYPVSFSNANKREVFIEGEAYFDVTKNKKKEFVVNTYLGKVKVLGTGFGVKSFKDNGEVLTTLVDGKVRFEGSVSGKKKVLKPGQQSVADKAGNIAVRKVNVEEFTSWKDGLHVFKDSRLEDIMNNVERWYNISVFYKNPSLRNIEFTGNLKRYENINEFLELLEVTDEVKFIIKGNAVTVVKP